MYIVSSLKSVSYTGILLCLERIIKIGLFVKKRLNEGHTIDE